MPLNPVSPSPEPSCTERFTWMDKTWNISRLLADIAQKKLRPQTGSVDRDFIQSYAEKVLAQSKAEKPVPGGKQRLSLLMAVDPVRAVAMPDYVLEQPLVLVHTAPKKGILTLAPDAPAAALLADGNHRVCKAFFQDVASLPMLVLSRAQSNRYLV